MPCRWRNSGVDEEGYDPKTDKVLVKVDSQYFRPAEVEYAALMCRSSQFTDGY